MQQTETKKCSNCVYSRNDKCSAIRVCEDWKFAKPTPSYYPTWSEMRGGIRGDYLRRKDDWY